MLKQLTGGVECSLLTEIVMLACRQLKGPHTHTHTHTDVLACTLNDIHSEFGIQNKVV